MQDFMATARIDATIKTFRSTALVAGDLEEAATALESHLAESMAVVQTLAARGLIPNAQLEGTELDDQRPACHPVVARRWGTGSPPTSPQRSSPASSASAWCSTTSASSPP